MEPKPLCYISILFTCLYFVVNAMCTLKKCFCLDLFVIVIKLFISLDINIYLYKNKVNACTKLWLWLARRPFGWPRATGPAGSTTPVQDCYKSQTCNYTKIKQFPMLVLFLEVFFHFIVTRLIDPTHHRLTVIIQAQHTDTTHSHIILTLLHHITLLLNCHIYYLLLVIVGDNSNSTMTSPLFL